MTRRRTRGRRRPDAIGLGMAIAAIVVVVVIVIAGAVGIVVWQRGVEASLERPAVDDKTVFIAAIAPLARASMKETGVPASVAMGQAILESGWGTSALSNWSGNYFGIKCGKTVSPRQSGCVAKASQEYYDPKNPVSEVSEFRTYASARDSFMDHGFFLRNLERYAGAFDHTDDPDEFIRAVREAGYATDPKYADLVISLMSDYDLYRFNDAGPAGAPVQGAFSKAFREQGGADGPLGAPLGAVQDGPVDGTEMMLFESGVILEADGGAYALSGPVWQRYRRDAETRQRLGVPVSVEGTGAKQVAEFEGGTLRAVGEDDAEAKFR